MKKLLKYLLFVFCNLLWVSSTNAADDIEENTTLQKQIIQSFRNSFGLSVLEEGDSTAIYTDSLLSVLETGKQYDAYFELSRIVIKSQVLKGETRMAIAHSDVMYSKAKAQNHFLGLALSLSAIGEVYAAVGRNKEAGDVYERSLEIFERHKLDEGMKKTLLVELIEYNIRMENADAIAKYLGQLSQHSTSKQSELERDILRIFNAYYKIQIWKLEEAGQYLAEVREHQQELIPALQQYFMVAEAFYLKRMGKLEEALKAYDHFFSLEHASDNYAFYVSTMKGKAELLEKMGQKEEAASLYNTIYSYINSVFKANYPKLCRIICKS